MSGYFSDNCNTSKVLLSCCCFQDQVYVLAIHFHPRQAATELFILLVRLSELFEFVMAID